MACPEGQYFCHDRGKCMPIPKGHKVRKDGELVKEVAPPGWGHTKAEKEKTDPSKPKSKIGGTIAAMKRAQERGDIPKKLNIFALAYSMKNKGAKPHYKPGTDEKYKKYQEAKELESNNIPKRDKKPINDRFKTLHKIDMKGTLPEESALGDVQLSFEGWKQAATDAIKRVARKKEAPKHEYPGRDAGEEYRKKLRKKDHETVNFLDPDD